MIRCRRLQLKDEIEKHIRNAEELFNKEEHVFGLLDLKDMQLSEGKSLTTLKDLLDWKLQCAESYFKRGCHQQGIRCLIFAIPLNHEMGENFQQTQNIIERAQAEIINVGGVFLEQVLFINAVSQALIRAPEYGYARKSLEDYLDRLPSEISPKNLGAVYSCLRGAYTNLGDFDKALRYAELALKTSLEAVSYNDASDAAFALAVTKLDCGRRLPQKSIIAHDYLLNSIIFLRDWVEKDRVKCYPQQEIEKCAWLASVEFELGHVFGDEHAFIRSDNWLKAARQCGETH
ncbi:MAG: hypothetical protein Q9214_005172, partial [Letrouitia sp. 1 TL-2023]